MLIPVISMSDSPVTCTGWIAFSNLFSNILFLYNTYYLPFYFFLLFFLNTPTPYNCTPYNCAPYNSSPYNSSLRNITP